MKTRDETESALLIGVLAHRLELARADVLVAAFNQYTTTRDRPFVALLCDQATLSAEAISLLEEFGDRLVLLHGGVWEALMSLRLEGVLGSVYERAMDPQLRTTIARLCPEVTTVADPYATVVEPTIPDPAQPAPRFHSLKLHARGGLGEVFLARDEVLSRDVALKEIQPRYADDLDSRARFVREARITGSLEHPGIVPVYTLGNYPDGRPFYTMRFIDGKTLKQALDAFHATGGAKVDPGTRLLELRRLLSRFVDVCNTIHFAHTRGVLHRDIKPANIMLGQFGEAVVVDWGLGKTMGRVEEDDPGQDSMLTQHGVPIGTLAFMSPEQANGRLKEIGPASDIYSLGATLYCLMTGKSPFEGKDGEKILADVRRGHFPRPREVCPTVSHSLEAICLKAMAFKATNRYASAGELADDLERWLAGEPISAVREPTTRRLWRWGRRNRWVASMIGATSVAIVTVFLFSSLIIAPLALCLALVGGSVGAMVGVLQGKATHGAQKGAEFGFRVGTVAILALFVLWLAYMAYHLLHSPGLRPILPLG